MSRGSGRESIGTAKDGLLHVRKAGSFKTLCGLRVPVSWFAWSLEVFQHSRSRCTGCAIAVGLAPAINQRGATS